MSDDAVVGLEKTCSNCGVIFWICQHCWRGQKYCGPSCRADVRKRNRRVIERRYASTQRGQESRRRRQKNYRRRKIFLKTITDHSSSQQKHILEPSLSRASYKAHRCTHCENKVSAVNPREDIMNKIGLYFSFTRLRLNL